MVRLSLEREAHARLRHLALDLGITLADVMREGVLLALRYHGRAEGLGEPKPPVPANLNP